MDEEKIEKTGSEKEPVFIAVDIDPRMNRNERMKKAQEAVRSFAKEMGIDHLPSSFFSNKIVPEKPCLKCSKPHIDPRGFCSAACCKEYKAMKTAERKEQAKNEQNTRTRNRKGRR